MGKRGPTEAGSIARATWRAMLVEVVGWIRRHALLSLAAGTIFIVLLAVAVGGPLRRLAPLMAVALVLVWAVRRSGLFSSSLGDTGDVVVLTGAGRRLVVPWSQVKRVWMTSSRSIWSTQVSIQVETSDGVATQRTTLPIAEPGLVVAVFRQLSQSTAFLAACEARGVDVRLGSSGLPDTEPGLVVSWASLYDVVQREPHRYGGVHQGPENTGILQVVRGQTRLTPGRHIGAVVADAVGIPARDLMADVIVVECRHSPAVTTASVI